MRPTRYCITCPSYMFVSRRPYLVFAGCGVTAMVAGTLSRPAFTAATPATRNDIFRSMPDSAAERQEMCLDVGDKPMAESCLLTLAFRASCNAFSMLIVLSWLSPSDLLLIASALSMSGTASLSFPCGYTAVVV